MRHEFFREMLEEALSEGVHQLMNAHYSNLLADTHKDGWYAVMVYDGSFGSMIVLKPAKKVKVTAENFAEIDTEEYHILGTFEDYEVECDDEYRSVAEEFLNEVQEIEEE